MSHATAVRSAAAALAALVVLVGCSGLDDPAPDDESAQLLTLEAAGDPGEAPFTASVESPDHDPVFTDTIVARTIEITQQASPDSTTGALQVVGTAPGLYGGSGSLSVCDPDALVAFLADDGDKAAAWAGVLGLATDAIDGYVAALTPLVLTADTLVTNHGFTGGAATAFPAVLQAGTAVLVDARGLPVVRCACGNPLLAPRLTGPLADAETSGAGWDGLDLAAVVAVDAAATDVTAFTVSDLTTGELVEVPVGASAGGEALYIATTGNHAQVAAEPAPYAGSILTSPDGVDWTVALETSPMADVATGGGLAVAVGMNEAFGGAIHTSADGVAWSPAADVIDPLSAVAYGDGVWIAVGNRSFAEEGGEGDGSGGAIYRSDDGATWQRVATTDPYQNSELPGTGEIRHQAMTSVAYGGGRWIATATECEFRTCMRVLFTSTDTRTWTRMALDERIVLIDIAHDGEQWAFVGGEPLPNPQNNAEIGLPIGAGGTSPDGVTWSLGPTAPDRLVLTGLNPGDGEWLAVDAYVPRSSEDPPATGGVYRSNDLLTWERLGTAAEWGTSVALLRTGTVTTPPAEQPETTVATVRIRTEGVELLDDAGARLALHPFTGPATAAIDAVSEALGAAVTEQLAGDGYCSADRTAHSWGALQLVHDGTDTAAVSWLIWLAGDAAPGSAVAVDGPDGVTIGQDMATVRSSHPDAPYETLSHQGVTYEYLYLDVVGEKGVEVGGQNGTVTQLLSSVYVEGDC